MTIQNLDRIFRPNRIAVVGASDRPESVGRAVLRNLISGGYQGVVYPVNPVREAVHGIQAYPDVASLPRQCDLAVVAVPAQLSLEIVRQCGESGIGGVVILSAGFREAGGAGRALEEELGALAATHPGLRILGPNCLGVIVPGIGLNATFGTGMPRPGRLAFLSQSGALCTSVLDWAIKENIGFSNFVSVGNALDIDFGDLIDYCGEDPQTDAIIVYIESIRDARRFMSASRAFARRKPIVAYKAGRHAESARAAASHTGAIATEDEIYDAAFERAGIVRVHNLTDMFECAELLARCRAPLGPRLGIVTNGGGPGVMATDALVARQGVLASLCDETMVRLNLLLPSFWSRGNPVDVLCDASPDRYVEATRIVVADPGVDAALIVLTPQAMARPTDTAEAIAAIVPATRKPVLAAWMGGEAVAPGARILAAAGVPTYTCPEKAVAAFMSLVSYARNIETLYETPREIPATIALDRVTARALLATEGESPSALPEASAWRLLSAYGIPMVELNVVAGEDEAVACAQRIGGPVVLKLQARHVVHKSEIGAVALNLRTEADVRAAYRRIVAAAPASCAGGSVAGVVVQPMLDTAASVELILGARMDPVFGSVMMIGAGGINADLMRDHALGLPPLTERLARRMLESLRCYPLLSGYRARPPVAIERLVETMIRLSYLVADCPEIEELDINPLLASPDGVVGIDACVIARSSAALRDAGGSPHLAIPPCPDHYACHAQLPDGTTIVVRPVRPEDEPLWHRLLAECSPETVRGRFHHLFQRTTHEMGTQACFVDYDRELALVAQHGEGTGRRLVGVCRLAADPDRERADLGVLVVDRWQGRGVGSVLVRRCVEVARDWGLARITARTAATNTSMRRIFARLGFEQIDTGANEVTVRLCVGGAPDSPRPVETA